ncbi:DUF5606 domain-containing protein [Dysgonomonas sp. 25]|uniref:DUF5606 family protein n=1 Tax=Dysgonomonas sp. 25 TaxID=2302933 RepID=UPI0013D3E1E2|nr:DUF5606 domain-containing protein [Dysgonomonas sp. 25]NDV67837.1 hypothetical protein [Dysgonomonas sp. 25]
MLKTILSVSGKPGLYKLVSNGKNMIIVESLADKRKLPIHARDKVVSLGDISIYTDEDETPLREVFISMKKKENGAKVTLDPGVKPEELKKYLAEVLPNFDRERVYPTDIKKMINWYNLLLDAEIAFEEEDKDEAAAKEESAEPKKEAKAAAKKTEKAPAKKPAAKKDTAPKKETKAKTTTNKSTVRKAK